MPQFVKVELFKHKERIAAASGLDANSVLALLRTLLERITFYDEESISVGSWTEALPAPPFTCEAVLSEACSVAVGQF